ncbi:MAG: tetratricopeptide repeat protein [Alphaproteobacteria bacterium]|nr:tetratricopeptide repeat protein [Alphaproteobacteria bacterium]
MDLFASLKWRKPVFHLFTASLLISCCSVNAEDTNATIGDLNERIAQLEDQLNAKDGKAEDANPGSRVTHDDLNHLKEEMRRLNSSIDHLKRENEELRQQQSSSKNKASPPQEGVEIKSRSKAESWDQTHDPTFPQERDDETESLLHLLELSAPKGDENKDTTPPKKGGKTDVESLREAATKQAEDSAPQLVAGNAQAQYNEAFALYNKNEYKESRKAFDYFIKTYPNDPLVSKAIYWKAKCYINLEEYDRAKPLLVKAYKMNPKSSKAADCMVDLGDILAKQGKKEDACTVWNKVKTDFPNMGDDMKKELSTLKKKYKCE